MTDNYQFISHYNTKNDFHNRFNELAQDIFDLDFTEWFNKGYSKDHFVRFSFVYKNSVIANACANMMHLVVNGVPYKAIQIGTVMTDENHRNEGLAKQLIEKVIETYENEVDFFFLYANDTVLDFYPKIGFQRMPEHAFTLQGSKLKTDFKNPYVLKRLNCANPTHFSIIERLVKNRYSSSSSIQVVGNAHLLLFHLMIELDDIIYYVEEDDLLLLFEIEGKEFYLYDIIAETPFDLQSILARLIPKKIKTVHFYFEPEKENLPIRIEKMVSDDDVLFVRSALKKLPENLYFPLTSRA